jgi:hypothetical protein
MQEPMYERHKGHVRHTVSANLSRCAALRRMSAFVEPGSCLRCTRMRLRPQIRRDDNGTEIMLGKLLDMCPWQCWKWNSNRC